MNEHGKFGMTPLHSERTVTNHACRLGRTMIGVFSGEFEQLNVTINDAQKIRDAIQRTAGIAFQEAATGILQGDSKSVTEAISAVIIPYLKDIQSESIKDRELQDNKDLEEAYKGQRDWLLAGDTARFEAPERQHFANLNIGILEPANGYSRPPIMKLGGISNLRPFFTCLGKAAMENRIWSQLLLRTW